MSHKLSLGGPLNLQILSQESKFSQNKPPPPWRVGQNMADPVKSALENEEGNRFNGQDLPPNPQGPY